MGKCQFQAYCTLLTTRTKSTKHRLFFGFDPRVTDEARADFQLLSGAICNHSHDRRGRRRPRRGPHRRHPRGGSSNMATMTLAVMMVMGNMVVAMTI